MARQGPLLAAHRSRLHRGIPMEIVTRLPRLRVVLVKPSTYGLDGTVERFGRGVSFAVAEAELIWSQILADAVAGELQPVYGDENAPWQEILDPPVLIPPDKRQLHRYAVPMLGVYPARGCPYRCNFCSVIQI